VSAASSHFGFRRLGGARFVGAGMFITLLIHGALVVVVYVSQFKTAPRPEAERDLMVTQLVTLGKPREKFWLPRIVQPPPPKIVQPTIKVAEDPNAPPAPKEAPKPEDKEISKDLRNALKRAQMLKQAAAEEEAEGSLTGSAEGTTSTASTGDEYATLIYNAIRKNWSPPAGLINDAQLNSMSADVRVSIAEDGTIENTRLQKGSGNDLFDDSCVQAVKATGRVPPPPAAVRAKFRRGAVLAFDGKSLAR
jgi:TonB family protein